LASEKPLLALSNRHQNDTRANRAVMSAQVQSLSNKE